ncbi:MAG: hypothetical protein M5U26_06005 [Planctomycetota bacterium]|nr:hypothetical protein [Planctomycetota bacterium]
MNQGKQAGYYWLHSDTGFLDSLVENAPELVLGKHVVVTSFDSGPLKLSAEEIKAGWFSRKALAYSPRIKDLCEVPSCGFSEWYVFNELKEIGDLEVFVNYSTWALADSVSSLPKNPLIVNFWDQMTRLRPFAYAAEGIFLNLAVMDEDIFNRVRAQFSTLQS